MSNRYNNKMTLVVASCDAYEDVWSACSRSIELYWPDRDCETVLVTETKDAPEHSVFDRAIKVDEKKWTKRLYKAIEKIETDYIFFMLEDLFSTIKIDQEVIIETMSFLEDNPDVGVVYMESCGEDSFRKPQRVGHYYEIPYGVAYRSICAPSIWDKGYLKQVMDCDLSAWEFERRRTFDVVTAEKRVLTLDKDNWKRLTSAGGIHQGKWMREMRKYSERIGVDIDYDRRPEKTKLEELKHRIKGVIFNINTPLIVKLQNIKQ